jgi:hypothetical protein
MWAILAESPAVSLTRIDVGGSAAGTQTGYSVYGTSGQNRPTVEGIVARKAPTRAGFYYDYGSFEDVNVETAAHSAEMPWPGVQSMFVAKSGGNTYHGSWYSDYENKSWQSFNVDASQINRGAQGSPPGVTPPLAPGDLNRTSSYRDINTDAGGFIQKDRVWWYGSFRNQKGRRAIRELPGDAARHRPAEFQRQRHVSAHQEQQGRRLRDRQPQTPADAARFLPARKHHRHQYVDRVDVGTAVLGVESTRVNGTRC